MHVVVLGRVGIVVDGVHHGVDRGQTRALLALLALNVGEPVSTDAVMDALWGGAEPATARAQIQNAVSAIRRAFVDLGVVDAVAGGRYGYRLNLPPSSVDIRHFDALTRVAREVSGHDADAAASSMREALGLWRGAPLADASGAFVGGMRVSLEERRLLAIELLSDIELARHRPATVIAELLQAVTAYPFRESLRSRLMLALYHGGRHAEALQSFRTYREMLAEQEGLDPGIELSRVALEILRGQPGSADVDSDEVESIEAGPHEATSGPDRTNEFLVWLTPRQLPAATSDFTGRAEEIDKVATLLSGDPAEAGSPTVVALSGQGGVGKTTLAVHAARRVEMAFPDGCLFVDLQGTEADPPQPHAVMSSLLLSLGVPAATIPTDPEARGGLYRTVTAGRRLLLILDNAADSWQVRPLLPVGSGCSVLITSRLTLTALEGLRYLELDNFAPGEALGLLTSLAGSERVIADTPSAARIVSLCDYLPLAVRLVGIRLRHRRDLSLARTAARLTSERDRLDELAAGGREVRASIALGVAQLDPESAALLRGMAMMCVPDVAAWVAAASLGTGVSHAERVLDRLRQASLLSVVEVRGETRYRPHDLIRLYAQERALIEDPELTRAAAARRVYDTLLRIAQHADHGIGAFAYPMPDPLTPQWIAEEPVASWVGEPLAWFEDNRDLLVGAVRGAIAHGWLELAWQLAVIPAHFFSAHVFDETWQGAMESALVALQRHEEPECRHVGEAALLLALGGLLRQRGEPARALTYLRSARLLYRRHGDAYRAAVAATQLGMLARGMGRLRVAESSLNWAISTFRGCPNVVHDGWAHIGRGNLLASSRADLDGADEAYQTALRAMRRVGDAAGEANALGCLGMLRDRQGRLDDAAGLLRAAQDILVRRGNLGDRGPVELALARVELQRGQLDEAWMWQERALSSVRQVRLASAEAEVLRVRADLLLRSGRPEEAVTTAREAIAAATDTDLPLVRAEAEFLLAQAHRCAGDLVAARSGADRARRTFASIDHPRQQFVANWSAELAAQTGP